MKQDVSAFDLFDAGTWAESNLFFDIVQGIGRINGKADQNDVRIWV